MEDITKIVGDRIRTIRKERGLSQEQLAHKAEMEPAHIGRLERGERNPSLISLQKVINALDITFEDLFKYIQPTQGGIDSTTISLIVNRLNTLNVKEQKLVLAQLEIIFKLMNHKA